MEKHALNLDEMLLEDAKRHLNDFATTYPDEYDEINCDLKQLRVEIVHEISNYLLKNGSPSVYAKTAEITCLGRKTIYRHLHS